MAIVVASTAFEKMERDPNGIFFMEELMRLGYTEGQSLIVERYSAERRLDRYEAIAREVVKNSPDIIVTGGTPLTLRLEAATAAIPVVTMMGIPRFGIITNLARAAAI